MVTLTLEYAGEAVARTIRNDMNAYIVVLSTVRRSFQFIFIQYFSTVR